MTVSYETLINGRVLKTAISNVGIYHLSYILAEERISDELGEGRITYSVFAAMCGDGGEKDSAFVRDLTSSVTEAEEFFTLITEGTVTPCTLRYVAEDFAASK